MYGMIFKYYYFIIFHATYVFNPILPISTDKFAGIF